MSQWILYTVVVVVVLIFSTFCISKYPKFLWESVGRNRQQTLSRPPPPCTRTRTYVRADGEIVNISLHLYPSLANTSEGANTFVRVNLFTSRPMSLICWYLWFGLVPLARNKEQDICPYTHTCIMSGGSSVVSDTFSSFASILSPHIPYKY